MCDCISFLRIFGAALCITTLGLGGYFYGNHYQDLDCGDMRLAITLGLSSTILFLINIITYISSCNKKWVVWICGLFLLGSTGYNIYIAENLDDECKQNYKDKNMWDYCIYMYIAMIVLSVTFVGLVLTSSCFKKKNEND